MTSGSLEMLSARRSLRNDESTRSSIALTTLAAIRAIDPSIPYYRRKRMGTTILSAGVFTFAAAQSPTLRTADPRTVRNELIDRLPQKSWLETISVPVTGVMLLGHRQRLSIALELASITLEAEQEALRVGLNDMAGTSLAGDTLPHLTIAVLREACGLVRGDRIPIAAEWIPATVHLGELVLGSKLEHESYSSI